MIAQSVPDAGQIRPNFSDDGPSGRTQVVYQEGWCMRRARSEAIERAKRSARRGTNFANLTGVVIGRAEP